MWGVTNHTGVTSVRGQVRGGDIHVCVWGGLHLEWQWGLGDKQTGAYKAMVSWSLKQQELENFFGFS